MTINLKTDIESNQQGQRGMITTKGFILLPFAQKTGNVFLEKYSIKK